MLFKWREAHRAIMYPESATQGPISPDQSKLEVILREPHGAQEVVKLLEEVGAQERTKARLKKISYGERSLLLFISRCFALPLGQRTL